MSGPKETFTKDERELLAEFEQIIDGRLERKLPEIALHLDRDSIVITELQRRAKPQRYQAFLLELSRRFWTKGRIVDLDEREHAYCPLVIH